MTKLRKKALKRGAYIAINIIYKTSTDEEVQRFIKERVLNYIDIYDLQFLSQCIRDKLDMESQSPMLKMQAEVLNVRSGSETGLPLLSAPHTAI